MKKRGTSKKALSGVIGIVLILLITVIAVVIIWNVYRNVIKRGEGVNTEMFMLRLKINKIDSVLGNKSTLIIERDAGEGRLYGIVFKFTDKDKKTYVYKDMQTPPDEISSKTYIIDLTDIIKSGKISTPISVEIYPVTKDVNGKESLGLKQDEMTIGYGESSGSGTCIPSETQETSCTDSLDNDCDGLADCEDSDCVITTACCGDGVCSSGENCDSDASTCQDRKCWEPACTNGCSEQQVASGGEDEACSATTGCATPPCSCDGTGNCIALGTPISSCPYSITSSGNYYLANDLAIGTGNCITLGVLADDVVINGNNKYIRTTSNYGIYLTGASNDKVTNTEIKNVNFEVSGSSYGIYGNYANNLNAHNNHFILKGTTSVTDRYGIFIINSPNSEIINNLFENTEANLNGYGIVVSSASDNSVIKNNIITNNNPFGAIQQGIYVGGIYSTNNILVENNTVTNSNYIGIAFSGNANGIIKDNKVCWSKTWDVSLSVNCVGQTVFGNKCDKSSGCAGICSASC